MLLLARQTDIFLRDDNHIIGCTVRKFRYMLRLRLGHTSGVAEGAF